MTMHYEYDPDAYDSPYYDEEAEKRSTDITDIDMMDWPDATPLGGGSLLLYNHDSPVFDELDAPDSIREARDRQ